MMTQHNKVAAAMIYHPFLMICILILALKASTNLNIIVPFIAVPTGRLEEDRGLGVGVGVKAFDDLDDIGGGLKFGKT